MRFDARTSLARVRSAIVERDEKIERLEAELAEMEVQRDAFKQEHDIARNQLADLRREREEYKAKWDGKEGVIAIERYDRRGHFMDRLHDDKDRLEAELAKVKHERYTSAMHYEAVIRRSNAINADLEAELADQRDLAKRQASEVVRLATELAEMTDEMRMWRRRAGMECPDCLESSRQLADLRGVLAEERHRMSQHIHGLEMELADLRKENDALKERMQDMIYESWGDDV